jgi:hypothetical protein
MIMKEPFTAHIRYADERDIPDRVTPASPSLRRDTRSEATACIPRQLAAERPPAGLATNINS